MSDIQLHCIIELNDEGIARLADEVAKRILNCGQAIDSGLLKKMIIDTIANRDLPDNESPPQ